MLLHGMASTSGTWAPVLAALARRATVIAPDLPGHGGSGKPLGDYSLGSQASAVRDLLSALGHDRATVAGHSFGGGIALQFAYQFPERCERLVLVSSGGLGRDVNLLLRALSLPGAEFALAIGCAPMLRDAGAAILRALGAVGFSPAPGAAQVWESYASLADAAARATLVHTLRSVIDAGGQRVSAADRLYLAAMLPTLIIWGAKDRLIPVAHARSAHEAMPGSHLEIIEGVGHFPHHEDPAHFVRALEAFVSSTSPAQAPSPAGG